MKIFLLTIIGILFVSGCAFKLGTEKNISISVTEKEYQTNNASKFVQADIEIVNNLGTEIYFGNLECNSPLNVYQLSAQNKWDKRTDLTSWCMGFVSGKDIPAVLKSGKKINTKQTVSEAGAYKIEFVYYLNESDYKNKTSPQSIYSNEFTLIEKEATPNSVIDICKKNDPIENRVTECIYVAAKNAAEKDLNLSLELCGEIKKLNYGFDGCYDGVALMLRKAGQTDKITEVCNNYNDATRVKQCLKMAQ